MIRTLVAFVLVAVTVACFAAAGWFLEQRTNACSCCGALDLQKRLPASAGAATGAPFSIDREPESLAGFLGPF